MTAFIHWNDGVSQGIFALAGVLVGGLITAGTTLYIERRREKREVRAAARQLHDALKQFRYRTAAAAVLVESSEPLGEHFYRTAARESLALWGQFERLFAASLRRRRWAAVSSCMDGVKSIAISSPGELVRPEQAGDSIDSLIRRHAAKAAFLQLDTGIRALGRLAGADPLFTQDGWPRMKRDLQRIVTLRSRERTRRGA